MAAPWAAWYGGGMRKLYRRLVRAWPILDAFLPYLAAVSLMAAATLAVLFSVI